MNDERFLFQQGAREKKIIGHSAAKKRTHTGKSGKVTFPSDNLSAKELKSMNGEVKTYNINSPMRWAEFKRLPDDLKIMYIKCLREKFDVYDTTIFKMFGIAQQTGSRKFQRLGLGCGKDSSGKRHPDLDSWYKWVNGIKEQKKEAEQPEIVPEDVSVNDDLPTVFLPVIPLCGEVTFCGAAIDALGTVERLLNNANVRLTVKWEAIPEPCEGRATNDAM